MRQPLYESECHGSKTNLFLDMNGIPFILGEYFDSSQIMQLDRSQVYNDVRISSTDPMRTDIFLNIDHVGKRSDGNLAISSNASNQRRFAEISMRQAEALNHMYDVVKSGIIARISYRIEDAKTYKIIGSRVEEFRIFNRSYYNDITSGNLTDCALVTNMYDQFISTIADTTYGLNGMMIFIDKVELFYEVTARNINKPGQCHPHTQNQFYNHHKLNQFQTSNGHMPYDPYQQHQPLMNPNWLMFNRFYRFDNGGKDLILHDQEIYNPNTECRRIPCGVAHVNRRFAIVCGTRLVFTLNIWKKDVTVFHDTRIVAGSIGERCVYGHGNYHCPPQPTPPSSGCTCGCGDITNDPMVFPEISESEPIPEDLGPVQESCQCPPPAPPMPYPGCGFPYNPHPTSYLHPHSSSKDIVDAINANKLDNNNQQLQIQDLFKMLEEIRDAVTDQPLGDDEFDDLLDNLFPESEGDTNTDTTTPDTEVPESEDVVPEPEPEVEVPTEPDVPVEPEETPEPEVPVEPDTEIPEEP